MQLSSNEISSSPAELPSSINNNRPYRSRTGTNLLSSFNFFKKQLGLQRLKKLQLKRKELKTEFC